MGAATMGVVSAGMCVACSVWTWMQLRFYARIDTPPQYFAAVLVSWWMGVVAVAVLLPLDVATMPVQRGDDDVNATSSGMATTGEGGGGGGTLLVLWRINYWVTFVWCWVVCPMVMEFWAAGQFTPKAKLLAALRKNGRFYARALLILIGVGVLVAFKHGFQFARIAGFFIAAANLYGMVLVVLMLGYGLVEVPREVWYLTNPKKKLSWHYCTAPLVEGHLLDVQTDLLEVVEQVERFQTDDMLVQSFHHQVLAKAQLARDTCLEGMPPTRRGRGRRGESLPDAVGGSGHRNLLEELHYRLKKKLVAAQRAKFEWEMLLQVTERLEQQVKALGGEGNELYRRLDAAGAELEADLESEVPPDPERHLSLRFKAWRAAASVLIMMSLVLLWNESVAALSSKVSVTAVMIHNVGSELVRWLLSAVPLVYMTTCVYVALFKFKLLDGLALHGNKQTDVYCLLMNASYLGRLQFSLGVNYINQLHPEDRASLAFYQLVGDMDVVPFLGSSFNSLLPLLIVVLAACTYFKVFDRVLNLLGIETHTEPGSVENTDQMIKQGRLLISRNRARLERRSARSAARQGAGEDDFDEGQDLQDEQSDESSFTLRNFGRNLLSRS